MAVVTVKVAVNILSETVVCRQGMAIMTVMTILYWTFKKYLD